MLLNPPSLLHNLYTDTCTSLPPIIHTISLCLPPLGQKTERNPGSRCKITVRYSLYSPLFSSPFLFSPPSFLFLPPPLFHPPPLPDLSTLTTIMPLTVPMFSRWCTTLSTRLAWNNGSVSWNSSPCYWQLPYTMSTTLAPPTPFTSSPSKSTASLCDGCFSAPLVPGCFLHLLGESL